VIFWRELFHVHPVLPFKLGQIGNAVVSPARSGVGDIWPPPGRVIICDLFVEK
jgi:hypothetical protein